MASQRIADWLKKLGMSEYAERFAENDIDIDVLSELTDEDLEKLGVSLGHRRKMLRAIRDLGSASVAVTVSSAPLVTEPIRKDDAERRQLTVMFTDLVGSTALSTKLDLEDLRSVIGAYHKCVGETVARFGGFIARYMRDGVLVYRPARSRRVVGPITMEPGAAAACRRAARFGVSHEDNAERAVRAGLTLVEAVRSLAAPEPLQMRIGIGTGLVVVGDLVGSGEAQERGVVGELCRLGDQLP